MYKFKTNKNRMKVNESYQGETIEQKIRRIVNNKEPITDGAPLIYSERNKGVLPAYDIRTDRFEIALEAMDKVNSSRRAQRETKPDKDGNTKNPDTAGPKDGKTESTGGGDA